MTPLLEANALLGVLGALLGVVYAVVMTLLNPR
jgi:hypothetical protein